MTLVTCLIQGRMVYNHRKSYCGPVADERPLRQILSLAWNSLGEFKPLLFMSSYSEFNNIIINTLTFLHIPFGLGLNVLSVHYCALKWPVRSHQPPWWAVCTQTPWVNKTFQGHVYSDTSGMAFNITSKSWKFITNGLSESFCGWALVVFFVRCWPPSTMWGVL